MQRLAATARARQGIQPVLSCPVPRSQHLDCNPSPAATQAPRHSAAPPLPHTEGAHTVLSLTNHPSIHLARYLHMVGVGTRRQRNDGHHVSVARLYAVQPLATAAAATGRMKVRPAALPCLGLGLPPSRRKEMIRSPQQPRCLPTFLYIARTSSNQIKPGGATAGAPSTAPSPPLPRANGAPAPDTFQAPLPAYLPCRREEGPPPKSTHTHTHTCCHLLPLITIMTIT